MSAMSSPTPEQLQALLNSPALTPPPGVVPNFVDPPNSYDAAVAINIVFLVLSTLSLAMRIYTKVRIMHQMALADYSILLGWGVFVGLLVPAWYVVKIAPGVHQWNIRLKDYISFSYYIYISSAMYGICIFFVKLSILLQYLQIFVPLKSRNALYWTSHALIWTNFVFYLISVCLVLFGCKPIAKAWNPLITNGHCIDTLATDTAAGAINSLSDIVILVLPQVSIWRLQMALRRKIQISALFFIGLFACVCSIVRLAYATKLYRSTDITYYGWNDALWAIMEMASGIIVACLPLSAKFFQGLEEMGTLSKIRSSLKLFRNFTVVANRRRTDDHSAENYISSSAPTSRTTKMRAGQYKTLSDRLPLAKISHPNLEVTTFGDDEHNQHETHIMRTINIDTRSEPNDHDQFHSLNSQARTSQPDSSHGISGEV
ncbi:hypothetical protein BDR22DRAFT_970763 [Usnea florida]